MHRAALQLTSGCSCPANACSCCAASFRRSLHGNHTLRSPGLPEAARAWTGMQGRHAPKVGGSGAAVLCLRLQDVRQAGPALPVANYLMPWRGADFEGKSHAVLHGE